MDARTALVAFVCLLLGGAGGWFVRAQSEVPNDPPAADPAGDADAGAGPALETDDRSASLGSDRTRLQAAQTALDEERELRRKAESQLEHTMRELATYKSGAEEDAETTTVQRYSYDKYDKALKTMNWKEAGQAISKMGPLLVKLAGAMANGEPYIQIAGDIQRYNGPLVRIAGAAQEGGLPGSGVNGAFTHPSVLANLVYATLKEAGTPLDEAQESRLKQIGTEFVEEDDRRLAGYDEMTFGLKKLVDETELKDRFYAAVDRLVTDEQREILHPEALRGRVSFDLFSSGLVWGQRIAPLRYRTQEELEAMFVAKAMRGFGVSPEQKSIVETAVGEWARGFPDGFLAATPDSLELAGRFKIERVRVAGHVTLAFYEALIDRLPADSQAAPKIRDVSTVGLPIKLP